MALYFSNSPADHSTLFLSNRYSARRTDKWSARKTVVFVVATCGAFWLVAGFLIAKLIG